MNNTHGGKMDTREHNDKGPVMFLLGVIVVGVLVLVLAAVLLRKPPQTDPFDAPSTLAEPAAPAR
jgi:hypothetical protein